MSTDPNNESSLRDVIEARYSEWEQEFGDEIIVLRANSIKRNEK